MKKERIIYWLTYDGKEYELWSEKPSKYLSTTEHKSLVYYSTPGTNCKKLATFSEDTFELFGPNIVVSRRTIIQVYIEKREIRRVYNV